MKIPKKLQTINSSKKSYGAGWKKTQYMILHREVKRL